VLASARTGLLLKDYISRPFVLFSQEACKLGLQGIWSIDKIRRECREFFRQSVGEACREKLPGVDPYDFWGCSAIDWIDRQLREGPLFRDYQDRLLEVAAAQSKVGCPPAAQLGEPPETRTAGSAPAAEQIIESGSRGNEVAASATASAQGKPGPNVEHRRSRPGPLPDSDSHRAVKEIVDRIVPRDVPMIEKLDEVCEALDEAQPAVPVPSTWRARESPLRNWTEATVLASDRELAVKAIKYRLIRAHREN
jgi:hypothetical protein